MKTPRPQKQVKALFLSFTAASVLIAAPMIVMGCSNSNTTPFQAELATPPVPTVSIAATTATTITVSRTGATTEALPVFVTVVPSANLVPENFTVDPEITDTFTIPAGSSTGTITISPTATQPTEAGTVTVTLLPGPGYEVAAPPDDSAFITIPGVTLLSDLPLITPLPPGVMENFDTSDFSLYLKIDSFPNGFSFPTIIVANGSQGPNPPSANFTFVEVSPDGFRRYIGGPTDPLTGISNLAGTSSLGFGIPPSVPPTACAIIARTALITSVADLASNNIGRTSGVNCP